MPSRFEEEVAAYYEAKKPYKELLRQAMPRDDTSQAESGTERGASSTAKVSSAPTAKHSSTTSTTSTKKAATRSNPFLSPELNELSAKIRADFGPHDRNGFAKFIADIRSADEKGKDKSRKDQWAQIDKILGFDN
jgi:hypothetical protein